MNTIYLISYPGDSTSGFSVSAGFATDEEGIKQLALDWYWTGWEEEKCRVEVNVDMDNRTVTVYNPADKYSITYDILTFKKIA